MLQVLEPLAKREKPRSDFGERLKALREKAGLSVAELGTKAGMKRQAVSRFERGEVEPTWPTVLKLAEALGVPVGRFQSKPGG